MSLLFDAPLPRALCCTLALLCLHLLLMGNTGCPDPDGDGDGYTEDAGDCDDTSASTYPGATEVCDGVDNDCDPQIDEDGTAIWYLDADLDAYGVSSSTTTGCSMPAGYAIEAGDCDDADNTVYPDASEECDGKDNDCDSLIDDGANKTWYRDADLDAYGVSSSTTTGCPMPAGYAVKAGDCDDADKTVYPDASEKCDGKDNDCDGLIDDGANKTWYRDADVDAYGVSSSTTWACPMPAGYAVKAGDCDDADKTVYPYASEKCDGKDNDCDGQIDDGLDKTWYADNDQDGHGNPASPKAACAAPSGYVSSSDDCDDSDKTVYAYATEKCDGKDNDCDSKVDESATNTYYPDADADGHGDPSTVVTICDSIPAGYVHSGDDCDDADPRTYPDALETCDGRDNDCDGVPDDGAGLYRDFDGDGQGIPSIQPIDCSPRAGYVASWEDCDDLRDTVYAGALERCDGLDNDCDTVVDEGFDQDTDGYVSCGVGVVPADCDDLSDIRFPDAQELCNGIDDDCDGIIDEGVAPLWYQDADADGFGGAAVVACTSQTGYVTRRGDCDDLEPDRHPGAEDPLDGIDQDCGGFDGPQPHVGLSTSSLTSIQAALDAASSGATVWVGPGTFKEHDLTWRGRSIRLRSTDGPATTVIDASRLGRVLVFSSGETADARADGFTLTGGYATQQGGAVYIRDASPTLIDSIVSGNSVLPDGAQGGGLYLEASSATLTRLIVRQNTAAGCSTSTEANGDKVQTCGFGRGGGLYLKASSARLTDCVLRENQAVGEGGGAWIDASDADLSGLLVLGNTVKQSCDGRTYGDGSGSTFTCSGGAGGGLFVREGAPGFTDGALVANIAASFCYTTLNTETTVYRLCALGIGGGAALDGSSAAFDGTVVQHDSAARGGGLHLTGSTSSLTGALLYGNRAVPQKESVYDQFWGSTGDYLHGGEGGAIWIDAGAPLLTDTAFAQNQATKGGALHATGSSARVSDTRFDRNLASGVSLYSSSGSGGGAATLWNSLGGGYGAAVYLNQASISFVRASFLNGTAVSGAGLYLSNASPTLESCDLSGNRATGWTAVSERIYMDTSTYTYTPYGGLGGALYVTGGAPALSQTVLSRNSATGRCADNPDWNVITCADGLGGGLYARGKASSRLERSILAFNAAYNLYAEADSPTALAWSDLYAPDGDANHNLTGLDASVLLIEPGFLEYDALGLPVDRHLALSSPLIDAGDPAIVDVDGSRSDPGIYGGMEGDGWDRDGDGSFDWFWPGTIDDAPDGVDPTGYDCLDTDPTVQRCED